MLKKTATILLLVIAYILSFLSSKPSFASQIIDFDISYYRYLNTDTVKNRDYKTIEEIIYHWASAFYEATNGECTLGTIRIFQGTGKYISDYKQSDIVWEGTGHPAAASGAGKQGSPLKSLGCRINMYDIFRDETSGKDVCNFLKGKNEAAYAGYILASIASSYIYDLKGEYAFSRGTEKYDQLTSHSLMKDPSSAAFNNNRQSLNYSVKSMYKNEDKTEQMTKWGMSGWEYLVKNNLLQNTPDTPPKKLEYSIETDSDLSISKEAIENLHIIWVYSPIYILTIDRSGSMNGDRIEKAKFAAKDYLKNLKLGVRIGIVDFADDAVQTAKINKITASNETSLKKELMNKIDSIPIEGNGTSIYDACFAADTLMEEEKDSIYEGRHIILITDGEDNSSKIQPEELIALCRKSKTAINVVGLEEGVNEKNLRKISEKTQGFYIMTANPLDTQEMLYTYMNNTAESQICTQDFYLKPGEGKRIDFWVDEDAEFLRVNTIQANTSATGGLTVQSQSPSGKPVTAKYELDIGKYESIHKNPSKGVWISSVKNNSKEPTVARISAYVSLKGSFLFMPSIQVVRDEKKGNALAYACFTGNGIPYTGLTIKAYVNNPDQTKASLEFTDKGILGDAFANDGVYTAQIKDCKATGNYRITASFKNTGNSVSATHRFYFVYPKGSGQDIRIDDSSTKLLTQLERVATVTFQVKNKTVVDDKEKLDNEKPTDHVKLKDKLDMGYSALKRNDYDTAMGYANEALRITKKDGRIYRLMGEICDAKNDHINAVNYYLKAVEYEPGEQLNYYKLGQAYTYLKEISKAKEVWEIMSAHWPGEKWTNQLEMAIQHAR
jgi:tetratricopeptide (TPR) repeat protein/Mg-chelatase subunit ChlD